MELSNPVRYERQVRAIIVFGDIRGFSTWEQKAANPDVEFKPLMNRFDAMVDKLETATGWFTKNLGDGYMQVVELPAGHSCGLAAKLMEAHWQFGAAMTTMFKKSPWPRPDGFRIRVASGHIWKKEGSKHDYVGRYCNMTHKLLRVSPDKFFLCHQSFVELMTRSQTNRAGFCYAKAEADRRIPDGVLKADATALWELKRVRKK